MEFELAKKSPLKQLIVTMAVTLLIVLNGGMAQTPNEKIRNIYFDNIVRLAVEALNDSCINIALCEVPDNPWYNKSEVVSQSGGVTITKVSAPLDILRIKIEDLLRGNVDMDTVIILKDWYIILREGMENQYPIVNLNPGSKWIMYLESPFLVSRWYHTSELKNMEEYEKDLKDKIHLNSENYFTLYKQDSGALCIYFPENEKYPPMFIYSEGLVDDFRTIIKLQEDPSLLSESTDSYESHYNSMKEELGRRVFSRLFESLRKE